MPKAKAVGLGLSIGPAPTGLYIAGTGGGFTPELATVRDFEFADAHLHNMQFVIGGSDVGNGVIGANWLGTWDTEFDLGKGAVNFFTESGCGHTNIAYWASGMTLNEARLLPGQGENDRIIYVEVFLNGHALRAVLDSGAPSTSIGRKAAARSGIDLDSPQVVASMKIGGIGSHLRQSWVARTSTIAIGGEQISNSPIRIVDDVKDQPDQDMLLGMDFLMAHHVMVSPVQHKMIFTYNGGPIFSVSTEREVGHLATRAENMGVTEHTEEPKTADDFAGRGTARLTRNDMIGAISDLTEAIRLAPGRADLLADRAKAYARGGHPELAARDIDAALTITPKDYRMLTWRAQIRLGKGDKVGALADADAAAAATPKGSLDIMPVVTLYERHCSIR
jgi:hypothetical protein